MAIALTLVDLFKSSFYATPHPYLLLNPNLKIIDANDCYLAATMTRRGDIMQAGMFDVFPDNPADPNASGVANLSQSLIQVLDTGKLDRMPLQRYDVRDAEGAFQERWWQPLNIPVFDEQGHLATIVHYVEDVSGARRGSLDSAATPRDLEGKNALATAIELSLREADAHFVRQKEIINELKLKGQPARTVELLMGSLEQILAGHRQYAQKLRRAGKSRASAEALHSEWAAAIAVARSRLNRLDDLLGELRHSIGSSKQAIDDSRMLMTDRTEGGDPNRN